MEKIAFKEFFCVNWMMKLSFKSNHSGVLHGESLVCRCFVLFGNLMKSSHFESVQGAATKKKRKKLNSRKIGIFTIMMRKRYTLKIRKI